MWRERAKTAALPQHLNKFCTSIYAEMAAAQSSNTQETKQIEEKINKKRKWAGKNCIKK